MRPFLFVIVAACGGVCAFAVQDRGQPKPVEKYGFPLSPNFDDKELPHIEFPVKPNADRLKGMKDALKDIENGVLKQKLPSLTEPKWVKTYVAMLGRLLSPVECEAVVAKEVKIR